MRKFLILDAHDPANAREWELSPLSREEFTKWLHWQGNESFAFEDFLLHNKFVTMSRFSPLSLQEAVVELRPGESVIDLSVTYGKTSPL